MKKTISAYATFENPLRPASVADLIVWARKEGFTPHYANQAFCVVCSVEVPEYGGQRQALREHGATLGKSLLAALPVEPFEISAYEGEAEDSAREVFYWFPKSA